MNHKNRLSPRFDDMGRFESNELCALPGTLENISKDGCKVRFHFPIVVDLDNDYESKITFARAASEGQFSLVCHPQWARESNGTTEIGFRILPSKDFARLSEYVAQLCEDVNSDNIVEQISGSVCQMI